jgi:hypothetical protein
MSADNMKSLLKLFESTEQKTKQQLNEGIMDVVKQTFNDCVVGYPMGTSEGQFIQGWARAIRALFLASKTADQFVLSSMVVALIRQLANLARYIVLKFSGRSPEIYLQYMLDEHPFWFIFFNNMIP